MGSFHQRTIENFSINTVTNQGEFVKSRFRLYRVNVLEDMQFELLWECIYVAKFRQLIRGCRKNTKKCCPQLDAFVSGSPIVQDGHIIGAVTHVFISDSTQRYGIFIENMLEH